MRSLLLVGLLLSVGLAGCFGFTGGSGFDYVPGQDWEPTGKTVDLKATVVDWTFHEVYPGFVANLWAFCFEPSDPNDEYSANAVEYWNPLPKDGIIDQEAYANTAGKCSVPGPTLRVQQGDLVRVNFGHSHFHPHTIHWHGQHLPWKMDGVPGVTQDSVTPGSSITYEFLAARAGTLWYHCHVDTQFHVMQGLFGVFIVEPQEDQWEPEDIDQEYVLVFSSLLREHVQVTKKTVIDPHINHKHQGCGASGTVNCQSPPVDVHPDTWMLNGRSSPNTFQDPDTLIQVDEGERVRIRILNAGETLETFHTHGHDMLVTHIDGNPLPPEARYYVDTLPIAPANRYDVVIDMNLPGLWVAHTHVDSHVTNSQQAPGGAGTMIAYNDIVEEQNGVLKAFESELFGGQPLIEDLVIPADVPRGKVTAIDATVDPAQQGAVSSSLGVPVAMPCAVRRLVVDINYNPTLALPNAESLAVTVEDALGNKIVDAAALDANGAYRAELIPLASQTPDPQTPADFVVAWPVGNMTVTVHGTATRGELVINADLDYVEGEDQLSLDSRILDGTQCDPATRVVDVIQFAIEQGVLTPDRQYPGN